MAAQFTRSELQADLPGEVSVESSAHSAQTTAPFWQNWTSNSAFLLAGITLVALLLGWLGNAMGGLPLWASVLLAAVAYGAGGYTGAIGAWQEARRGKLDIDFLMIAAALGAAAIGSWQEGALLLFLFTLSGALEEFAMERTRRAIESLANLRPDRALVRREDVEEVVAVESLVVGDIVLVRPGERLPIDGQVLRGNSAIDQSPITGESVPVAKAVGDAVFAGTINGSGALEIEVRKPAGESTLSKIIDLVEEAQEDAAPTQRFIDRFSQPYTYGVIALTLLAIAIPQVVSDEAFRTTFYRAMTLLVVASPCALIISTPASILSAIAAAARNGVLFKGGAYLERVADVTAVAFDKTGTLTNGAPVVTDVVPLGAHTADDLLRVAAGAELLSEHHIGRAIVQAASERGLVLEEPDGFNSIAGRGLRADYRRSEDGGDACIEHIFIGNQTLFEEVELPISAEMTAAGQALQRAGKTAALVVRRILRETPHSDADNRMGHSPEATEWDVMGFVAVADSVRPEAVAAVAQLRRIGITRMVMLTGDHADVAANIGAELGIDEVYAELLPEEKVEIIRRLAQEDKTAMVGDGVNDAPALATATVGVAMGAGGTDVALETADVVLMASDLSKLPFALKLSRRASQIVRQNVIFSIGVIVALVLTTTVLPLFVPGFVLPLPLGVVGHEGSTLVVVANGLRMLAMRSQ